MTTKLIYVYHPDSGEFLNFTSADESPLEPGLFLIPAHATDIVPPTIGANEIAVFIGGAWAICPDFRWQIYYDQTSGAQVEITTIGSLPANLGTTIPSAIALDHAKAAQIAILAHACQAQIYAGFTSSALGAPYIYPATGKDQMNLAGSVLESLYPNLPANWTTLFWCADVSGAWALRPHTIAQIHQVGADGKAAITSAISKNATLAAQVADAATDTIAKVEAIVW